MIEHLMAHPAEHRRKYSCWHCGVIFGKKRAAPARAYGRQETQKGEVGRQEGSLHPRWLL
jgi:hypothetical protein